MAQIDKSLSMEACQAWKANHVLDDDSSKWIDVTWQECLNRHNRAVRMIVHIMGCEADELSYWEHIAYTAGFEAARSGKELEESRNAYQQQNREY